MRKKRAMRIETVPAQPTATPRAARTVRPAAPAPLATPPPDTAELSRRSEQLLRAAEAAVQADAARAHRVAELRAQIRDGSYQVDHAAVARALLKHE